MQNIKLEIDNYPAQKAMGFYKISDSSKEFARKGLEAAGKTAEFYAQTGDKLSDFAEYQVSDLAAEIMYSRNRELVIAHKPGPNIDFKA
ncbi:MAG: DUF6470 family protein [Halanaerobium sp.]